MALVEYTPERLTILNLEAPVRKRPWKKVDR